MVPVSVILDYLIRTEFMQIRFWASKNIRKSKIFKILKIQIAEPASQQGEYQNDCTLLDNLFICFKEISKRGTTHSSIISLSIGSYKTIPKTNLKTLGSAQISSIPMATHRQLQEASTKPV
jgi:hypothetical protein